MREPVAPDPAFPRLTARPFPTRRFVNGMGPPPSANRNHHDSEPDATVEAVALEAGRWRESARFCWGIDLYNYAYWWEAHEAWEGVWRCFPEDHPLRHALQCMIQVSAAHLQRHAGLERGSQTLLDRARWHLRAADIRNCHVCGLDLETWWEKEVEPSFAAPEAAYPFLRPE